MQSSIQAKPKPHSTRGKITSFSRKSRKRMMISLANAKIPPEWFQGFTFADDVMEGLTIEERARYSEKVRKAWERSLTKIHPSLVGTWRREWKPRKSGRLQGQLVPHYHMMLSMGGLDKERFRAYAQDFAIRWVLFTKTQGRERFDALRVAMQEDAAMWMDNDEMFRIYVGKYMAKTESITNEEGEPQSLGRMWGKIGNWEEEEKTVREYGPLEGVVLKRTLKKLEKSRYRRQREFKIKAAGGTKPAPKTYVFSKAKGKAVLVNDPWGYKRHKQFLGKLERGETWMMVKRELIDRIFSLIDSENVPPF